MGWASIALKKAREQGGVEQKQFSTTSMGEKKVVENKESNKQSEEVVYFKDKFVTLNNGAKMPSIVFGTWRMWGRKDKGYAPVLSAIKYGCRAIDTAQAYNTEVGVGKAVKDSKVARKDIFISTKLDPDKVHDYSSAKKAFKESISNLQTEYIDIMYIHAPSNWDRSKKHDNVGIYRLLEEKVKSGEIRGIGISNFSAKELKEVLANATIMPAVVQLPGAIGYKEETELIELCKKYKITIVPYSPLASGYLLDEPIVQRVAEVKGVTKAQACLAFAGQKYGCFVFGSENQKHIKENLQTKANIFSPEDIAKIDSIDKDVRMWDYKKMWIKDLRESEGKDKEAEQERL